MRFFGSQTTEEDFSILLDDPAVIYFPGDIVAGKIFLKTAKEKRTQGLKLKLEGKSSVQWRKPMDAGSSTLMYYSDTDSYVNLENYLEGDGRSDLVIEPGEHSYQFSYQLPQMNLPSSFAGLYGEVKYWLEATIQEQWGARNNAKQDIIVSASVDLKHNPEALQPGTWQASKTFGCFNCCKGSDPLTMDIRLERQGYVPGEKIGIEAKLDNGSTRIIKNISVELIQQGTFYYLPDNMLKRTSKCIVHYDRKKSLKGGENDVWQTELLIPPIPPSKLGGCRLIDVQYVLQFEAHVSGAAFNLKTDCPIFIGTIPIGASMDVFRSVNPPEESESRPHSSRTVVNNHNLTPPFQDSYTLKLDQ